jgi:hypothetical protein
MRLLFGLLVLVSLGLKAQVLHTTMKVVDGKVKFYNGSTWDSLPHNGVISAKMNTADTTGMLLPYARLNTMAATYATIATVNGKANTSHTHVTGDITGYSAPSVISLSADVTNNNAVANSIASVTNLSFSVTANTTYKFKFFIVYTSAATTTGSRWSITGPAITFLNYNSEYSLTATSKTFNAGLSGYDLPAASNATSASTGSNIAIIEGIIRPSANGTVTARFASEVASSSIVAKGGRSYVEYSIVQ